MIESRGFSVQTRFNVLLVIVENIRSRFEIACANFPMPSSKNSDSDTIIAGSSSSEFDLDLFSDEVEPNNAQVASTPKSRTDFPISGRGTPATDQRVGDFQWQYLVEEEDLNHVE
ncbi:hypothetical protein PoB_005661100 [Plakobranchus ocellatus]|uniref:Uncharacterized protein n=1 Tax=Plakobranchus ocellatus TaxID=259542 RepID=A0AAV4CFF5_9GAST|nr:hypothetical protein PoB_005661100 [Plakobranchus ocellatus]